MFDISFTISKTANFFHFVSNLTQLHFSTRTGYGAYWLERTGELNQAEKEMLDKAVRIFRKYSFGDNYWGKVFLQKEDNQAWKSAGGVFSRDELETLQNLQKVYKERFDRLWAEDLPLLERWKTKLEETKSRAINPDMLKDLDTLFRPVKRIDQVRVILLMCSPTALSGGGANTDPGFITLEVSRIDLQRLRPVWLMFWHETVHSLWQTEDYWQTLTDFITRRNEIKTVIRGIPLKVLLNEAITESLFPYGVLAEKYFAFPLKEYFQAQSGNNSQNGFMRRWRDYSAQQLYLPTREYLDSRKNIDSTFIQKVYELVKMFSN